MRGFRCVCSILLMTTSAALVLVDVGGCTKHRLPGGLAKLKPCRLAGIDEELFCGKLTVFENRQTRTGRTNDLNIVVLPALDQKTKAEPLFDLAGGPGASSAERADFYASMRSGTDSVASSVRVIPAAVFASGSKSKEEVRRKK